MGLCRRKYARTSVDGWFTLSVVVRVCARTRFPGSISQQKTRRGPSEPGCTLLIRRFSIRHHLDFALMTRSFLPIYYVEVMTRKWFLECRIRNPGDLDPIEREC